MSSEIYKAPEASVDSLEENEHTFYVVSISKFTTLFFATLGIYSVYWFYKNWALYKAAYQEKIWAIPRAIFSIFFVHRLFREVDEQLKDKEIDYPWNGDFFATLYIISSVLSHIMDRAAEHGHLLPYSAYVSFIMIPVIYYCLLCAQKAINLSEDDAEGIYNSRFTAANIIWIVFGLILWALMIVMMLELAGIISLPVA